MEVDKMGQKKHPFTREVGGLASAGSNDLEFGPVEDNRLYCVQHIAVENETTAYTDLRLMTASGGREHLLEEQDSPAAATLYWTDNQYYLTEGQSLLARLSGCTASDVLMMYLRGWWKDEREVG